MSRLSRPFSLLQVGERSPELEDQIDFIDWRMGRSLQRATAMHDFKDWTMLFFSHEFDGTSWTKCITVNAISMTCAGAPSSGMLPGNDIDVTVEGHAPIDALPEEFLEAIEVNTKVLLAPIEFTAQKESRGALQQRFYKRKAELEKIKGPRTSESDRIRVFNSVPEKTVGSYDQKFGLVAPPLLFQTRFKTSACNKAVADPFLESQFGLINSSHCATEGMCPGVTGQKNVMQCVGTEASLESFFGLNASSLTGEKGFADFLFTYSDNPIVVRDGKTLPTRNFFDSKTRVGKVIVSFVTPGTLSCACCRMVSD